MQGRRLVWSVVGVLVTVAAAAFSYECDVESYFVSPRVEGAAQSRLVAEIGAAQTSILVAMYSFTDDRLGTALIQAKGRGVSVSVLVDGSATGASGSQVDRLIAAGISTRRDASSSQAFHHKFAVIDGKVVVTGSYNWTEIANEDNYENIVVIRCAEVAAQFTAEWDYLLATYSFASIAAASSGHSTTTTAPPCAFIGNKSSKVFHKPDCYHVAQMSESNKVCLASCSEASSLGYTSCGTCKPCR